MSAQQRSPDDDELDRLLEQARWPEPRDEQLARLGALWRRVRLARRRRVALGGLAVAASVLLLVAFFARRDSAPVRPQVASDEREQPIEAPPPESPSKATPPATEKRQVQPSHQLARSRDPNLYEQVLLMRSAKRRPGGPRMTRENLARVVEELIKLLAEDPGADIEQRLVALRSDLASSERLLWKTVRKAHGPRQLGAARLLARIASPQSRPVLVELANDPATHEVAVLGLARLASNRELARMVPVESDPAIRGQLLRALIARNTDEAVGLYLAFVDQAASRSEALGVLTEMENPPADRLLAYLKSPQQPVRLAAALALSRVPDAAVVERLCASVAGIGRREALIALLLNPSKKAAGCLNEARGNLYLVASVQAAERELDSLQISKGGHLP